MNGTDALPVAATLPSIVTASRRGPVVVTAPPGSGKTTLVPSAILADLTAPHDSVVLIQPRRLAARAVAHRIAHLHGSPLGQEVGYQVRFDRCATQATRLLVVTTGILLRRLCDDIDLPGVGAVILDEFHERTVEMDTVLGYLWRVRETLRPDLRIVVMSATMDAASLAQRMGNCPVVASEGRMFPVDITHVPRLDRQALEESVASVLPRAHEETDGHILVFLPGVGEIQRCRDTVRMWAERAQVQLLTLYGDLPPADQDCVLLPSTQRKLILSTNVAETSLTIEGVTAVIDSGLVRQLHVHPAIGLPRLDLVPISRASADQRAGRAGRTAAGRCWRLWDKGSHAARSAVAPPEILRSDLSQTVLQLLAWGERDILAFPWIDSPPPDAVADAFRMLVRIGACQPTGVLTPLGERLVRLPTHPRLARLLESGVALGVPREAALAAALLTERDPFRAGIQRAAAPRDQTTARSDSDMVDRVQALQSFAAQGNSRWGDLLLDGPSARNVLRVADQLWRLCELPAAAAAEDPPTALRRALLDAFPDRLARLRLQSADRGLMVGGRGVKLDTESRVRGFPFFLCLALQAASGDARVTLASSIDREWLDASLLNTVDELFYNPTREQVEARRRTYWDDLCLEETPVAIHDARAAAELLARYAQDKLPQVLPDEKDPATQFRQRVQWLHTSMPEVQIRPLDDAAVTLLLPRICQGLRSLEELRRTPWLPHWQAWIGYDRLPELDRLAPTSITLARGRSFPLRYEIGKPPILAVRIQELFGTRETPRVAGGRVPILLHLLGPNYRPQQITDDLASFWVNTYPLVRKELRRRYPKHAWPEDPFAP